MTRPIVRAAGGVLWRDGDGGPEVALVHRPAYDDWSLPKGKAEPREHPLVTALREVEEETGHRGRIGPYLTTVRYRVSSGRRPADKVVTYWAMREAGGSFTASREVDAMEWLPVPDAEARLTAARDRSVLAVFSRTPRDTQPLLLLRNGRTAAGARRANRGAPAQELSRSGRDQAVALVPVLDGLAVDDLRSADVPACVEMLGPYAESAGLTVQRDDRLTTDGFPGNERDLADQVRAQATSGASLAVCGPQRVISGLLHALGDHAAVRPPHDTAVKKGGWWLLHHRDGAITAYERHEPVA